MTENSDLTAAPTWPDLLHMLEWCGAQRAGTASPDYALCDRAEGHDGSHAQHDRETGAVTASWAE